MRNQMTHPEFLIEVQENYFYIKKIAEFLKDYDFNWAYLWILLENTRKFFDDGNHLYDLSYKNLKQSGDI